jgi:hypothetical protein
MRIPGHKGVWTAAAAAAILALFCFRVYSFQPREFFDFYHDDGIYFTTAKALAAGSGYIIPSFPGVLPETKYPVLYPLLLAVVWHIWPVYPANLGPAIALSISIASIYLALGYLFLRQAGASTPVSLAIAALTALHPGLSFLAGLLLSDYLFAALILASAMAADEMCSASEEDWRWGPITGLLLGLAMLARFVAIGAVAGILLYGMHHRRWRAVVTLALTCAVVVIAVILATRLTFPPYVAAGVGLPPVGFQHVLTYYSSYIGMWKLSVPGWSVLVSMLWDNPRKLMLAPGNYFIMADASLPRNLLTTTLALLVSTISVLGVVRWYASSPRRAIAFIFAGSLPVLLLWNYPIYDRFLLPFIPLILLGVVVELRRIISLLSVEAQSGDIINRIVAIPIAIILLALIVLTGYNYWHYGHDVKALSLYRAALNRERRDGYDWIARNTSPSARVLAYEDVLVYLYTGRQAIRPVTITTDCYYQPERPKCASDFSEMGSWAGYVGARYWFTDPADLEFEGGRRFRPEVRRYIADLKSRMHPVFVSSSGNVVVYDTTCLTNSSDQSCVGQHATYSAQPPLGK